MRVLWGWIGIMCIVLSTNMIRGEGNSERNEMGDSLPWVYVSAGGSDLTGHGTQELPYATLEVALRESNCVRLMSSVDTPGSYGGTGFCGLEMLNETEYVVMGWPLPAKIDLSECSLTAPSFVQTIGTRTNVTLVSLVVMNNLFGVERSLYPTSAAVFSKVGAF